MSGYTFWVDRKLDAMISFLREGTYDVHYEGLVEDLRICHDRVRDLDSLCIGEEETYRARCSKLLVAASIMRRTVGGRDLEYLDALEGVLLGVLRGKP